MTIQAGCTDVITFNHLQMFRARCSSTSAVQELKRSPRFASIQVDHAISLSSKANRETVMNRSMEKPSTFVKVGQKGHFTATQFRDTPQINRLLKQTNNSAREYAPANKHKHRVLRQNAAAEYSNCFRNKGANVYVFVIDTGCRTTHEQLQGRAIAYRAPGSNFVSGDDDHGHGTHVAATIAGRDLGVAKSAKIICVKAMSNQNTGSSVDVISAIEHIIGVKQRATMSGNRQSAYILSISLGVQASPAYSALDRAVTRAAKIGIIPVIAAGNSGLDACAFTPARARGAITVGAVSSKHAIASFSNRGPCVDVLAPGEQIRSAHCQADNAYARSSGTSMAVPFVSGMAALLLGDRSDLTRDQVLDELRLFGDKVSGIPVATIRCKPDKDLREDLPKSENYSPNR